MPESASDIPLFRRAPELMATVPHMPLGTFPTPVERFDLRAEGRIVSTWVKRDDVCAAGYAGNKVRKLEFILADARARGVTRLITAGATGSHHAFATAYHGRRAGFDVSLVLFPQTSTPHVRQMLNLDAAVGAELCWASRMETVPYGLWRARFMHRGEISHIVPPGGSSDIGTFGYINAGLELAEQIDAGAAERPSIIHVAAGTLGTLAGIGIGLAWAGQDIPVAGTRITARLLTNERTLAALVRTTLRRLRRAGAHDVPDDDMVLRLVRLRHDQIGSGYGRPTQEGEHATAVFDEAGLVLDATYTAKTAASLLTDARANANARGLPMFWHTLSAIEPEDLLRGAGNCVMPDAFVRYLAR